MLTQASIFAMSGGCNVEQGPISLLRIQMISEKQYLSIAGCVRHYDSNNRVKLLVYFSNRVHINELQT